jgi:hypothetical protein
VVFVVECRHKTDIQRKKHYQLSKRKQTFAAEDKEEEFNEKSKKRRFGIRGRIKMSTEKDDTQKEDNSSEINE